MVPKEKDIDAFEQKKCNVTALIMIINILVFFITKPREFCVTQNM